MRVHELAKEFDMPSSELIEELEELDIKVKNHMGSLTDEQVEFVRNELFGEATLTSDADISAKEADVAEAKTTAAIQTEAQESGETAVDESAPAEAEETAEEVAPAEAAEKEAAERTLIIKGGGIIVKDFAVELGVRPNQLIAELMSMNIFASITQTIDLETSKQIGLKHGVIVDTEKKKVEEHKQQIAKPKKQKARKTKLAVDEQNIATRPPVVTFLGHVDHGKTSLLDHIRKSKVADREAGGITQHIGAYTIVHNGKEITFLDTPGHAAFTKMRARGADLTDIAIIVIAADDGIMPQTKEAIQHAKAANVTIMIALNKVDLPAANPDNVKSQLQQLDLLPEEWGGETICVEVSAKTGQGMDELMEYINLQAEVLELEAVTNNPAEGYVIEAQLEKGRGPTCTVLVTEGTLKVGDAVVCGTAYGKIKALIDAQGKNIKEAPPSHAAKIMGLSEVPGAGDKFSIYQNEKEAKSLADEMAADLRELDLAENTTVPTTIEDLLAQTAELGYEELNLIVKSDVRGSLEAIEYSLSEIPSDKVKIKYILKGVGGISENDIILAKASGALVLGFNTKAEGKALKTAEKEGVEVRSYDIIYKLIEDVEQAMLGLLAPDMRENPIGKANIKQVFNLGKAGNIAGCIVVEGRIPSNALARVSRGKETLHEGRLISLRRFQDDVSEVRNGQECGIGVKGFNDFEEGDTIEVFEMQEMAKSL